METRQRGHLENDMTIEETLVEMEHPNRPLNTVLDDHPCLIAAVRSYMDFLNQSVSRELQDIANDKAGAILLGSDERNVKRQEDKEG